MSCTYFKASLDEDSKRTVRKLVRGVAYVFLQTPRHCFLSMRLLTFSGHLERADYKKRSIRKPTRGGEEKGCLKTYRKRNMGKTKKEEENWKNTRWLLT